MTTWSSPSAPTSRGSFLSRVTSKVIPALDYLKAAKSDKPMKTGKKVVIIGAGNVGCDVAAECYRLGADQVTLVDIQKPLAFGKEKESAEALGATFKWPVMTQEVNDEGTGRQ